MKVYDIVEVSGPLGPVGRKTKMTLKRDQYLAFEDIVGPEYISEDPEILYADSWRSGLYAPPVHFSPLFEAVILPRTTEEVQRIVKLCNKFTIQFKPSSTGWGRTTTPVPPVVSKWICGA